MFPLYDNVRARSYPFVTFAIIILNVLAFIFEISRGAEIEEFVQTFGFVPARYSRGIVHPEYSMIEQILPFVTSLFLHGGFFHLILNMWFLWIFGDNVEDRMGHVRFAIFYLVCGLLATVTHFLTNLDSTLPSVGASGAIAGVMGAYFILFPGAMVTVLVPFFFIPLFFDIPAFFFLGFWFIMQFYGGYVTLLSPVEHVRGIAWWAHAGGFLGGMMLVFVFKKSKNKYRRFYDDEFFPW